MDAFTWPDGTPRSQGNVFSWRTHRWDGPIVRKKKRGPRKTRIRSRLEQTLSVLRENGEATLGCFPRTRA